MRPARTPLTSVGHSSVRVSVGHSAVRVPGIPRPPSASSTIGKGSSLRSWADQEQRALVARAVARWSSGCWAVVVSLGAGWRFHLIQRTHSGREGSVPPALDDRGVIRSSRVGRPSVGSPVCHWRGRRPGFQLASSGHWLVARPRAAGHAAGFISRRRFERAGVLRQPSTASISQLVAGRPGARPSGWVHGLASPPPSGLVAGPVLSYVCPVVVRLSATRAHRSAQRTPFDREGFVPPVLGG